MKKSELKAGATYVAASSARRVWGEDADRLQFTGRFGRRGVYGYGFREDASGQLAEFVVLDENGVPKRSGDGVVRTEEFRPRDILAEATPEFFAERERQKKKQAEYEAERERARKAAREEHAEYRARAQAVLGKDHYIGGRYGVFELSPKSFRELVRLAEQGKAAAEAEQEVKA